MPESLLAIFKLCVIALLYLFFFRVLWAVRTEISPPAPATPLPSAARPARRPGRSRTRNGGGSGKALVIVEPADGAGTRYDISDEVTVGRAAGCGVSLDDTYASQIHARIFRRDGRLYVEDLGSTNGTYLNRQRVQAPALMSSGDRLQVGQTVLEVD